jgi:antitoxin VapB
MLRHMSRVPEPVTRRVKLFTNGRNQAVRIPREFELPGDEALMRKEGDRLIIEPSQRRSLLAVLEQLETLEEDLPEVTDPPPEKIDL